MRTHNRSAAVAAALALVAFPVAASSSPAQAEPVRVLYNPGSAVAFKPTYNTTLGGYQFKCAYAGWVQVTVNWSCDLTAPALGLTLSHKTGSFSSGSANPGPWFYAKSYGVTKVCTVAYASYANGSSDASSTACF